MKHARKRQKVREARGCGWGRSGCLGSQEEILATVPDWARRGRDLASFTCPEWRREHVEVETQHLADVEPEALRSQLARVHQALYEEALMLREEWPQAAPALAHEMRWRAEELDNLRHALQAESRRDPGPLHDTGPVDLADLNAALARPTRRAALLWRAGVGPFPAPTSPSHEELRRLLDNPFRDRAAYEVWVVTLARRARIAAQRMGTQSRGRASPVLSDIARGVEPALKALLEGIESWLGAVDSVAWGAYGRDVLARSLTLLLGWACLAETAALASPVEAQLRERFDALRARSAALAVRRAANWSVGLRKLLTVGPFGLLVATAFAGLHTWSQWAPLFLACTAVATSLVGARVDRMLRRHALLAADALLDQLLTLDRAGKAHPPAADTRAAEAA